MKSRSSLRALALAGVAGLAMPALATAGPTYSYADLSYIDSNIGVGGDGFQLRGSYAFHDAFFIAGQYSDSSYGTFLDLGVAETRLGIGWHTALSERTDFVAAFNLERLDIDTSFGSGSDNGFGLKFGLRSQLSDVLEVNGHLRYANYGQGADDTLLGVGVVYGFNERVSLVLDVEQGDTDLIGLGLRIGF